MIKNKYFMATPELRKNLTDEAKLVVTEKLVSQL